MLCVTCLEVRETPCFPSGRGLRLKEIGVNTTHLFPRHAERFNVVKQACIWPLWIRNRNWNFSPEHCFKLYTTINQEIQTDILYCYFHIKSRICGRFWWCKFTFQLFSGTYVPTSPTEYISIKVFSAMFGTTLEFTEISISNVTCNYRALALLSMQTKFLIRHIKYL